MAKHPEGIKLYSPLIIWTLKDKPLKKSKKKLAYKIKVTKHGKD